MKTMLLIASLLLAASASAQQGTAVVSGKANPELIADWIVTLGTLDMAVGLEDTYYEGGTRFLQQDVGLSKEGAATLLEEARNLRKAMREPVPPTEMCANRAQLEKSRKDVAAEIARIAKEGTRRTAAAVEAAVAKLSAEDAAKLAAHTQGEKANTSVFGVDDHEKATEGMDPKKFLDELCGRANPYW